MICIGVSTMVLGWMMGQDAEASVTPYETTSAGANDDLIRIHVIANSDSDGDQALKLKVRDAVLAELATRLEGVTTVEAAEAVVTDALNGLQQRSAQVIADQGYAYGVRAELGRFAFPGKSYGNLYLPAGEYKALRIVIGEGKGKNYWCLLFPNLCYTIWEFQGGGGGDGGGGGGADGGAGPVNRS